MFLSIREEASQSVAGRDGASRRLAAPSLYRSRWVSVTGNILRLRCSYATSTVESKHRNSRFRRTMRRPHSRGVVMGKPYKCFILVTIG